MALGIEQVRSVFDLWAPTYDDTVTAGEWGFEHYDDGLEWVCQKLEQLMPGGRVIDLGCGTGVLAESLQRRSLFIEYLGVDISPKMLQIARAKVPSATFLQADLRDQGFWGRYLDPDRRCAVVSNYALHHVNDEDKILVIERAFSASERQDLLFLIVDYAFLDAGERDRTLNEHMIRGNDCILEEVGAEYYANLSVMKQAVSRRYLDISLEKNGNWDWRIALRRRSNHVFPPGLLHRESSFG